MDLTECSVSHDRNKTELTQNITRLAALWLDERGFKPVETEVPVERKWISDIAGFCEPTQTELINLKLLRRHPNYPRPWNDPQARSRYEEQSKIWHAERDALPDRLTALIEVKTSINDYRGDSKWTRDWPANLCYVAMPYGMIDAAEWPKGWGVLLFSQEGTKLLKAFKSDLRMVSLDQQLNTVAAIAVCRDHKTRYERLRQLQKQIRVDNNGRKSLARIQDAITFVQKVMEGMPIDEAKIYLGIRCEFSDRILQRLENLRTKIYGPENS